MSQRLISPFKTIEWIDRHVVLIDQRRLPTEEVYIHLKTYQEVAEAIRNMTIRGAPAIGVATAMGIALAAQGSKQRTLRGFLQWMNDVFETFLKTRPTAANIHWAIDRMRNLLQQNRGTQIEALKEKIVQEAIQIHDEDIKTNMELGEYGKGLIGESSTILTHCNAGALATAGYGTALGVIRSAHREGKRIHVMADETRPFLQGARLTAWELAKDGISVTLITDSMVGHFMKKGDVDLVIVGADRITANGDVANKIGTYGIAVLAQEHNLPFYVAAPLSTFDFHLRSGIEIPIESRDPSEITHLGDRLIAPKGVQVQNPAFDITPNRFVTAIITEKGIIRPPYKKNLRPFQNKTI